MENEIGNEAAVEPGAELGAGDYREASEDDNSLLERIVVNAMNILSGEHAQKVNSILDAGKSPGEGLSNAITFVLQSVIGGLQQKGVEVSPELILSENGAASQITQLLVVLIGASGKNITPDEVQQALSVGIENFGISQRRQGEKGQQQAEQGMPPEQQGSVQGGTPPQQPQGILSNSMRA